MRQYRRWVSYPLTTSRLRIEPLTELDAAAFARYRQSPEVARWQSWEPTYSEADALALIANQPTTDLPAAGSWIQLAIRNPDASMLYGDVAVHRIDGQPNTFEIGVTLAPAAQRQGIGTEAVTRVLDHLFTQAAAHRVVAFCDSRNEPVARLLRRIGFRQESHQIEADYFKGEWTTLDGYAVLASERTMPLAATRPAPTHLS